MHLHRLVDGLRGRLSRSSPQALVRNGLELGRDVFLGGGVYLDYGFCWLISIGDGCTLAPRVFVLAHDASMKRQTGYTKVARTTIGAGTFVGAGTIVLPGVTIGENCVIGAGSVVSSEIPDGSLAVGSPARVIGLAAEHAARHAELQRARPKWPWNGWTVGGGITETNRAIMRERLSDCIGYVQ